MKREGSQCVLLGRGFDNNCDLSKLLGGPGPIRAKLMNFSTALGAVGLTGEGLCSPTDFAAKMFSLNFQSVIISG